MTTTRSYTITPHVPPSPTSLTLSLFLSQPFFMFSKILQVKTFTIVLSVLMLLMNPFKLTLLRIKRSCLEPLEL